MATSVVYFVQYEVHDAYVDDDLAIFHNSWLIVLVYRLHDRSIRFNTFQSILSIHNVGVSSSDKWFVSGRIPI